MFRKSYPSRSINCWCQFLAACLRISKLDLWCCDDVEDSWLRVGHVGAWSNRKWTNFSSVSLWRQRRTNCLIGCKLLSVWEFWTGSQCLWFETKYLLFVFEGLSSWLKWDFWPQRYQRSPAIWNLEKLIPNLFARDLCAIHSFFGLRRLPRVYSISTLRWQRRPPPD